MTFYNTMKEFAAAGLTPDEKSEFRIGSSEIGRIQVYEQQKKDSENFFKKHALDNDWMNDE